MKPTEYFFYEWLIIEKKYTEEQFNSITEEEFQELKNEYKKFYINNLL